MDEKLALRMMQRFEGYTGAHGGYKYSPDDTIINVAGTKVEIKSSAYTVKKPVTLELWIDHLTKKAPLGIIPVRDNATCLWGAIDIDDYDIDIEELIQLIKKEEYPLIVCTTKSGGAHLFLFMKDPVDTAIMQFRLREMAATLGRGDSEMFPKQRSVNWKRGDFGNWLNMPYFGDERHAYNEDGTFMGLEEFLEVADASAVPASWLKDDMAGQQQQKPTGKAGKMKDALDFSDGPPCLQHLAKAGLGEGQRNNGVFQFGIYARKKFGSHWQEVLERWNVDFVKPPLPAPELADIIRRLGKKEYFYGCKDQPIVSHCNSALCRTRKYGVSSGKIDALPIISGLSVLRTDPPLWFVNVNDRRVEILTEDLINYRAFQRICASTFFILFENMKQDAWVAVVRSHMAEATVIELTPEVGLPGQFMEILNDFIENARTTDRMEILAKRAFFDSSGEEENWRYYFRLKDLQNFLNDANFKVYGRTQIAARIRAIGGGGVYFHVNDVKSINAWWVPAKIMDEPTPSVNAPKSEANPLT